MPRIQDSHQPFTIDDTIYQANHLDCFDHTIPGKGRDNGDLRVKVYTSCHVYSDYIERGDDYDFRDHMGNPRKFNIDRFNLCTNIPALMIDALTHDHICRLSRDKNGTTNLAVFNMPDGVSYGIYFECEPSKSEEYDVRINIVSGYLSDDRRQKGNGIVYFLRQCLFKDKRIP